MAHTNAHIALIVSKVTTLQQNSPLWVRQEPAEKALSLAKRQLAERIGREQSFIGRIETRQRRVDLVEFIWIARCCGFDGEKELAKVTKQVLDLIPKKPRRTRR